MKILKFYCFGHTVAEAYLDKSKGVTFFLIVSVKYHRRE